MDITNKSKIGLDIDGVLADFTLAWHKLYPEISPKPNKWDYDDKMGERFKKMKEDDELDEFFLNIPTLMNADELTFEPSCYITSRPVDSEITEEWLNFHGFPIKPIITVGLNKTKIMAGKENNVEIFVDDYYNNFIELNNNGIFCYLYTAPWNLKYDVGNMRLNSLKELPILI